jgi:integrase
MGNIVPFANNKSLSTAFSRELPKYFTSEEVRQIISEQLRAEDYEAWFLCLFLWSSGARIGEAIATKTDDIDLYGRTLKIRTLKRENHTRVLPVQPGFVGEVALWLNHKVLKRGDRLFDFTIRTAQNRVKNACAMAGIDDKRAHPHTFRHSFAVNCIQQQVPVTVLKEWLGHRDITKTLIYTQILAHDTRVFMENIRF